MFSNLTIKMAEVLSSEEWRQFVIKTIATATGPTALSLAIRQYAAITKMPVETQKQREIVVAKAMGEHLGTL